MKIAVTFTGRKVGAIGIFYPLPVYVGVYVGEGDNREACVEDARRQAYAAGYEHCHIQTLKEIK